LWNFAMQPPDRTLRLEAQGIWSLAVAEGPTLAYGGGARYAATWNITTPAPKLLRHAGASQAVALSADGRRLATAGDRTIRLWDANRGSESALLEGHRGMVTALAFSPDGHFLASCSRDKTIRFWPADAEGPAEARQTYEWPIGGVHALAFAPNGMLAAAAGDSGAIVIWDLDHC
jgi:WD40 repeat protein